jgi:hypothetical protein
MELVEGHTSTRSFKRFGHVTDSTIRLRAWSKAETYCPNPFPGTWRIDIFQG